MWYRVGDRVIGVLCDGGEIGSIKPRYPGFFMAVDLLRDEPVPIWHLYRHDLESFFYVLVYVCAAWDPILKRFGHLSAWEHRSLATIRNAKADFLKNDHAYNQLFANAHSSLKALTARAPGPGCVAELYVMFTLTHAYGEMIDAFHSVAFHIGLPALEAQIRVVGIIREQVVTYETFMLLLDAFI
ncbi:hypothetical protein FOMPIDRAFT_1024927 [Fomitopsis schrenkii]|uniref:Fungal-type protein kinase domain-containing protein n=1 Tax=Fomitopsis schrenkii TaxID=2126942 RepID=S8FGT9_FOMSC|nr:hypothetical protein FOMPIDRAFT_1024927 [Fomitopsis schrenkii]